MRKEISESLTEQQYLICPAHINHYGRLFGGQLINQAYIDMVAIDCKGRPKEVPELELETREQRLEWEAAQKRRQARKALRKETAVGSPS